MRSPFPSAPTSLHALTSQVSGHPRVLTTRDGLLVIKLARPLEREFYQILVTNPALVPIRPFTPRFLGTLWLEGQIVEYSKDPAVGIIVKPAETGREESIVLENLAHGFSRPNILDIKLGTVFYDEETSPAKVRRVEKTARETTSWETGMRLTAFQVYDNNTSLPIDTPKSYGKSIRPCDLPDGIARFFPVGISAPEVRHVAPEDLTSEFSTVSCSTTYHTENSGLPCHILLPIICAIRSRIVEMRAAYSSVEMRMVGGSLLVMYESDWARAEEGVKSPDKTTNKGIVDGKVDDEREGDGKNGDDEGWRPYVVKLIDFAHAKLSPGAGPDEGVLKGMDTIIALLDGRIDNLRNGNRTHHLETGVVWKNAIGQICVGTLKDKERIWNYDMNFTSTGINGVLRELDANRRAEWKDTDKQHHERMDENNKQLEWVAEESKELAKMFEKRSVGREKREK
ncbi:hypothetical protein BDZ94DRAFT_1299604 [Collybia nuda]|uniref:Kinase n=1 Tax=Collybia nuda TaxID=64659 RepID=A0A9P5Y031_9AGAR|nr:hypothetical protein BDZ94DRAFT_1299604 [Collybia nuda]